MAIAYSGPTNTAPTHAGVRKNFYNKERTVYNWKPANTRKIKAAMGLGGYFGSARGSLLVVGDSSAEAQVGTSTWNQQFSWPTTAYDALTAGGTLVKQGSGGVIPGGYHVTLGTSATNGIDPRVSRTGTWTNNSAGYITGANGSTLTFPAVFGAVTLVEVRGTIVDVAYEFVSGSGFTVAIDGAAAVAVPMTGSGYKHYTVTGLADTTHSVVITVTTATQPRITGISVYRAHGFMIHNLSKAGSTAEEWAAFAAGGIHERRFNSLPPGSFANTGGIPNCGGVFIELGANDLFLNSRTAAQVKGYLQTLRSLYAAQDVVLVNYSEVGTPGAEWGPLNTMYYDLADEWDCPLIDLLDRTGGYAVANANGIMSADANHPNTRHQASLGAEIASLLRT